MSHAPALVHAQSEDRNRDRTEQEERGLLPAILRMLERARENRGTDAQREGREDHEEARNAVAEHKEEEAAPWEVPATSTETETEASVPPAPATTSGTSTPVPSSGATSHSGWGATTTPVLNTHNGVNSTIYADEWPLDRAQSGALFVLSMGLVLAGLLLAERDSLKRILAGRPLLAPPIPEKRTALS